MKKRRENIKEQYSIIITSQTDARKKTLAISITRRTLIVLLYTAIITIVVSIGVTAFSSYKVSDYSKRITDLEKQNKEQLTNTEFSPDEVGFSGFKPISDYSWMV